MANYLSLEEAAKKLGVPTERLVDLRSQGQVRGFRDGASWKFPESEIERLADELADGGGSGILIDEAGIGSSISKGSSGNIIGGDKPIDDGSGSDLEIGGEALQVGGSDVNLVAGSGEGSDVALVPSDSGISSKDSGDDFLVDEDGDLLEIDSKELRLEDPAILHDSDAEIDLVLEEKIGSDLSGAESKVASSINLGGEPEDASSEPESDLSFTGAIPDEDSDDLMIGGDESSAMDALGSDILASGASDVLASGASDVLGSSIEGSQIGSMASSLEMMDELDTPAPKSSLSGAAGADVLSELDLLSSGPGDSGLISGDSENLLVSSGLGSSLGDDILGDMDDALADDDDLVIADDDDDLVIDSSGTDISVAGDSGINLMSPSDSGLSLESEPLDLAGSSISALDLGAELADGSDVGSDPGGSDASGSMVDFQADEEFQLSPSGIGLEADFESGSQVIEVEDSEAIGEAVEFADTDDPMGGDAFATDDDPFADADDVGGEVSDGLVADGPVGLDTTTSRKATSVAAPAGFGGYEIPFSLLQCIALVMIISVLSLGGMLMTDLVRNMWTYSEPSAPVSSLTDALIELMGMN